jgi:hypothetical protein
VKHALQKSGGRYQATSAYAKLYGTFDTKQIPRGRKFQFPFNNFRLSHKSSSNPNRNSYFLLAIPGGFAVRKQTHWFYHDSDASFDPKIEILEGEFGNDGYAFYFKTLELLRTCSDHKIDRDVMARLWRRYNTDEGKLFSMIELSLTLGLFFEESGFIFSPSFSDRMTGYNNLIEAKQKAGAKGAQKRWGKQEDNSTAIAVPKQCYSTPMANDSDLIRSDLIRLDKNINTDLLSSVDIPENFPIEPLRDWLAYKSEKRQAYKKRGLRALVKEWSDKPDRFAAAVQYSMSRNYTGIFEEKGNGNGQKRNKEFPEFGKSGLAEFLNE